jgi:hypothetical protein
MTTAHPQGEFIEVPTEPTKAPAAKAPPAKDWAVLDSGDEGQARVLDPGKAPSWEASSYDLLTGLTVRDVTDTIPGRIFEEVFMEGRPLAPRKQS